MKYLFVCLLLAGCCLDPVVNKAPNFDARLMEECEALQEVNIKTFDDVLVAKASDTKAYIICKNKHRGLISAIKVYQKEFK